MFGTIKPCKKNFPEEMRKEYKKYYCGLCFAMDENFGKYARFLINYDITNEYILSASVRDDLRECEGRCPWSYKRKRVKYILCEPISDYYAYLNYLFVYHKFLDDIRDDGSIISKIAAKKMQGGMKKIDSEMNREQKLMEEYLSLLHRIEKENCYTDVETVAGYFGKFMEMAIKPEFLCDGDEDVFSKINYWTGVWIYTVDAISDCVGDSFRKRYNPITAGMDGDVFSVLSLRREELLNILKKCRENILQLLELYPTYRNREMLIQLFSGPLPRLVRLNLEVKNDEFRAQR